jgi:hypothetical protein
VEVWPSLQSFALSASRAARERQKGGNAFNMHGKEDGLPLFDILPLNSGAHCGNLNMIVSLSFCIIYIKVVAAIEKIFLLVMKRNLWSLYNI